MKPVFIRVTGVLTISEKLYLHLLTQVSMASGVYPDRSVHNRNILTQEV
jgi:hypothetical protein